MKRWSLLWIRGNKWKLLLGGMVTLMLISPIPEVYDRRDNEITPLTALVFLAVIFGTAKWNWSTWLLATLTLVWMAISVATEGSGIFAGPSVLAPALFMLLVVSMFLLLAHWMMRARHVDAEVMCAAICGYLLLGILWAGLYASIEKARVLLHQPDAFASAANVPLHPADLLYFSYITLTTTGYGDISPRGAEVRMLAVMEAMVGLFYNAIVIARFVSLYGVRKAD